MHKSYNLGRRHDDFMTSSYNQDSRPRRSTERSHGHANLESSTKKEDFLAQFNAANKSSRNKKDILSQSLNYERPKTTQSYQNSTSTRSSSTQQQQQPRASSRRSGEFSRHDRSSRDSMQRSYQSERPPLGHSADFASEFRKPLR
jgi:hypothetical protein